MRREDLAELVEPLVAEDGFELVDCSVSRSHRTQTFRVAVDRGDGVPVEACARLSRRIAIALDANPLLRGAYHLEVSSAGMNRRIWKAEHFARFAGEEVRMELRESEESPRKLQGTIGGAEGDSVRILLSNGEERRLSLDAVIRASLHMDPWKKRPGPRPQEGGPERESAREDA